MTAWRAGIEADYRGEAGGPSSLAVGRWLGAQAAMQADRWTLWTPVAFGLGAAAYFGLRREPLDWTAWIGAILAAGLLAGALRSQVRLLTTLLAFLACLVGGFSTAKLRQMAVEAPVAPADSPPQWIEGWVVDVASPGQGGQRLLIAPVRVGAWNPSATPIRLRVTLRGGSSIPAPGSAVSLLAKLGPPPPPASPGAYDFARDAYFESVGGVGFALGEPRDWKPAARAPWRLRAAMNVNAARWALALRIVETLGPEEGGLAAAMTSGVEAFLPPQQVENLRVAGLAHIVSISGLHMAIVGGFAFAFARLLVAACPWLALRISGKKAAALAGLAAVLGYLVLSGAPPPAERAAITASVAFGAILADRRAISLHALALAAMAVLLLQPEAVTEPGFQMSFAATAGLVAVAEAWPRPVREISTPWPIRWVQAAITWTLAAVAISLVAGLATGPFAIQHFNRVAVWGLVANLLMEPISTLVMMPGLALGAALTPFGLGRAPLEVAGFAIGLMNRLAAATAAAPHAQLVVASGPSWTLPAAFLGILWVCLWKGRLRWAGLPLAFAVTLAPKPETPDAWAAADGAAVAVRDGSQAILLRPQVKLFGAELWARRRGLEPLPGEAGRDSRFACEAWSCAPRPGAPVRLSAAWNVKRPLKPGRLQDLCEQGEIVILRNNFRPDDCAAPLVLTGTDFARGGAVEIYRTGDGWRTVWAQDLRGRRPWTWGPDPR